MTCSCKNMSAKNGSRCLFADRDAVSCFFASEPSGAWAVGSYSMRALRDGILLLSSRLVIIVVSCNCASRVVWWAR
jgi:hypothetical protein